MRQALRCGSIVLISVVLLSACVGGASSPSVPAGSPDTAAGSPTTDLGATAQAVTTALAQERAQPEAIAWRAAWLKAGREFFRFEAEAEAIAGGYDAIVARIIVRGLPRSNTDWEHFGALDERHKHLGDRLYLLPLPSTSEGQVVRRDLAHAVEALAQLRGLAREALLLPRPGTQERKAQAADSHARFEASRQSGRDAVLTMLQLHNLTLAEVGASALPRVAPEHLSPRTSRVGDAHRFPPPLPPVRVGRNTT